MKTKRILSYYELLDIEENEDIYELESIDEMEESDSIDAIEAGFMRGYLGEEE